MPQNRELIIPRPRIGIAFKGNEMIQYVYVDDNDALLKIQSSYQYQIANDRIGWAKLENVAYAFGMSDEANNTKFVNLSEILFISFEPSVGVSKE